MEPHSLLGKKKNAIKVTTLANAEQFGKFIMGYMAMKIGTVIKARHGS